MRGHYRNGGTARALSAGIAAALMALAVAACGQNELSPDPAACKAALQAQYLRETAGKAPSTAEPATCASLPKAEVQRFAAQVRTAR